ncbi:cytochrome c-type biogenesis protein ccsb, partial [Candidatus Magnetoovum chiemensis]
MTNSQFFGLATIGYVIAMIIYIAYIVFKNKTIGLTATVVLAVSFVFQTIAFPMRWWESHELGIGHAPFTNLYESLVFFVWCLTFGYLIIEFKYKNRFFGAFITPIAAMALGFVSLTGMSQEIQPLVPALQSNWLLAHVTMSFIAYSAFALSFATSLMYLIYTTDKRNEGAYIFWTISGGIFFIVIAAMAIDILWFKILHHSSSTAITNVLFRSTFLNPSRLVSLMSWIGSFVLLFIIWRYGYVLKRIIESFKITPETLDELTYKIVAVGFPVFTLGGLIFGAIWAD